MIQPLKNIFLVSVDREADGKIKLANGLELYVDKDFGEQSTTDQQESELYNYYRELEAEYTKVYDLWVLASKRGLPTVNLKRRLMQIEAEQKAGKVNKVIKPFTNAIQHGIVKQIPRKVDARVRKEDGAGRPYYEGYFYDTPLQIGDKVYFHHFVSQPENEVSYGEEIFYKADYNQIICVVRDGDVIPMEKWLLATPVMENEEDTYTEVSGVKIYTKISPEKKFLLSKVEFVGNMAREAGFDSGQTIIHPTFSEYALKIEGKEMYRMHIDDIFCVIEEN